MKGKVRRVVRDKGYGFIQHKGISFFFHHSALKNCEWPDLCDMVETTSSDISVSFDEGSNEKGPRAENVRVE